MKISLCLLTLNELNGCTHDVPRLRRDAFHEVFAIDGGSTDGTVEYLRGQGMVTHRQEHAGYNNACIAAFERCRADALVFFHPKGSIDPDDTLRFRAYLEDGYDLVIGSRVIAGARNEEDGCLLKPRKWCVIAAAMLTAALWRREGTMIWDVLHGCRAMRKDAFLAIDPLRRGMSIDLEMVARAYRQRLRRIEFPVRESPRLHGATHFSAFATGRQLMRYLALELLRPAPSRMR